MDNSQERHDLLIVIDATASMRNYVHALNQALPQIVSIAALTNAFERIGILAYRDYSCVDVLLSWSGWSHPTSSEPQVDLIDFARKLGTESGYSPDWPEAVKTGLAKAYEVMREDANTLMLLYADAPPHMYGFRGYERGYYAVEQKVLLNPTSYGGYGPLFADWISAARTLKNGAKQTQIICMLDHGQYRGAVFDYLTSVVGGTCLYTDDTNSESISETTIQVLLAWMGIKKDGVAEQLLSWFLHKHADDFASLGDVVDEHDARVTDLVNLGRSNADREIERVHLSSGNLETHLPARTTALQDFSKTYQANSGYSARVHVQLREIIGYDVTSISLNPVFGSLWRAVCNDRLNDGRQELVDLFGRKVNEIKNDESRAKMKRWLEESYDYTAEVVEIVNSVPEALRFPCVCLDPTLNFETDSGEEGTNDITSLRRDELLEIGRSCDYKILQRLGRVLTRLTIIKTADAMPAHLAGEKDLVKIPLALASKEYGQEFWRILLHTVVPGTLLGRRPAALLAALSIKVGLQPLRPAAEKTMLSWKDRWNNLEVPETWNISCLSLLIDADNAYGLGLLKSDDKALFERLIQYKMLEFNLATTLIARVAWTPEQTSMPVGPLVICKLCEYPRSVTVMGPDHVCGVCCFYRDLSDNSSRTNREEYLPIGVAHTHNAESDLTWYECNVPSCRAQYVVYYVAALNVRPKCHYCRVGDAPPVVECTKCMSRMIWPEEYRNEESANFVCMGCRSKRQTVVDEETTARTLLTHNGMEWLLENRNEQIKEVFNNRSLYHVSSSCASLAHFSTDVRVLPDLNIKTLSLGGKKVQNTQDVIEQIRGWVSTLRVQAGQCSLCFTNFKKDRLMPACGRSGCHQRVCGDCLQSWYGLNMAGRIINTAALHCPFCRRAPTPKTLAKYGMGIRAVGNLKEAVELSGEWIHAWCVDCGLARQYMERVCAGGAPAELRNWSCELCQLGKGVANQIKPCPGCGILTEKTGGCDHIQCPTPACDTHWCFHCGEKHAEESIYDHMEKEHGGYYGGLRADDYESDEDF